ncbi:unnamed protein product [Spirodela intermedia]|uniref:Uncharacterized protein n=1 Tax=Spirodela intermedia TaxID=51605 RepID=A0A7I8JVP3_SPIIN|nr:unnamed protein product [Spirodela intermedia]
MLRSLGDLLEIHVLRQLHPPCVDPQDLPAAL